MLVPSLRTKIDKSSLFWRQARISLQDMWNVASGTPPRVNLTIPLVYGSSLNLLDLQCGILGLLQWFSTFLTGLGPHIYFGKCIYIALAMDHSRSQGWNRLLWRSRDWGDIRQLADDFIRNCNKAWFIWNCKNVSNVCN